MSSPTTSTRRSPVPSGTRPPPTGATPQARRCSCWPSWPPLAHRAPPRADVPPWYPGVCRPLVKSAGEANRLGPCRRRTAADRRMGHDSRGPLPQIIERHRLRQPGEPDHGSSRGTSSSSSPASFRPLLRQVLPTWARVVRVDPEQELLLGYPSTPPPICQPRPRSSAVDLNNPRASSLCCARRQGHTPDRGLPTVVTIVLGLAPTWPRPPAVARLRAHHRLGPGRPLRPHRRARHQLHRPGRRARADRPARRPAVGPAQPRG